MADAAVFALAQHTHAISLLAHLEELRKRIIFSVVGVLVGFLSCWSYADRIFGLMQQPIILALRHHGFTGGLVYLNPTEPFNLYLEVGLVAGLFAASPFVFYQLWLFIAPGLYRNEQRYILPFLISTVGLFIGGGVFGYKLVYPASLDFLIGYAQRFQPMITIGEYTKLLLTIIVVSRPDFRNAGSRVLSRFDAGDYGPLDVAESAICHTRDFRCRGNCHTDERHLEHVSFRCPDGRALRYQYRSSLAGEFIARAWSGRRLTCVRESALPGAQKRRVSGASATLRPPARNEKRQPPSRFGQCSWDAANSEW
jgi:Tat protein translocase TatC